MYYLDSFQEFIFFFLPKGLYLILFETPCNYTSFSLSVILIILIMVLFLISR